MTLDMAVIGYRRVSTIDQRLDRQDLGECDRVFEEKVSGKDRNRPELEACLAYLRPGDTLRCMDVSRLARSLVDLVTIVKDLTSRGVVVEFLHERLYLDPADTNPNSVFQLQMWAAMAEYERAITAKRRDEGIAKAKERGVYRGRVASLDPAAVREAKLRRRDGVTVARLAKDFRVTEVTMSKALRSQGIYGGPAYV